MSSVFKTNRSVFYKLRHFNIVSAVDANSHKPKNPKFFIPPFFNRRKFDFRGPKFQITQTIFLCLLCSWVIFYMTNIGTPKNNNSCFSQISIMGMHNDMKRSLMHIMGQNYTGAISISDGTFVRFVYRPMGVVTL